MSYQSDQKKIRLVMPDNGYRDFNVNAFPRKGEDFNIGKDPFTVLHVRLVMSSRGMFDSAYVWCAPREVEDETASDAKLQVVR